DHVGVDGVHHRLRRPGLFEIDADDLAGGVDAGVGAAGGGDADGLAAEGGDGALDRALHRRLVGLGLEAVVARAVVLQRQPVARHQPSTVPAGMAKPRSSSSAGWAALPGRCTVSRRTTPSPQATRRPPSRPASSTSPGAPSPGPETRDINALTRTGPSGPGASNHAPGKGDRPRMWQSISAAGRVQSMRASAGVILRA